MTKLEQDIFFAIIRAAIWTDDQGQPTAHRLAEAARLVPDGYDWSTLIQSYEDHAMLGVVAHAILRLPSAKRPTQPQQDHLMSHVAQLVRQRYTMRQTIVSVFDALSRDSNKITPILLKGEGLATLYPSTTHRSVGDIDVYVGQTHYQQAIRILMDASGNEVEEEQDTDYHYHLHYHGTEVEIHCAPGRCANRSYLSQYLAVSHQYLQPEISETIVINGHTILTPYRPYNLFYTFNHLLMHWQREGIGIRQFNDLALLLKQSYTSAITLAETSNITNHLRDSLTSCGLLHAWQLTGAVIVDLLGLPQDQYPFYDQHIAQRHQPTLRTQLLSAGNFGIHNRQFMQTHGIRYYLSYLSYTLQYFRKQQMLFPGQGLLAVRSILRSAMREWKSDNHE